MVACRLEDFLPQRARPAGTGHLLIQPIIAELQTEVRFDRLDQSDQFVAHVCYLVGRHLAQVRRRPDAKYHRLMTPAEEVPPVLDLAALIGAVRQQVGFWWTGDTERLLQWTVPRERRPNVAIHVGTRLGTIAHADRARDVLVADLPRPQHRAVILGKVRGKPEGRQNLTRPYGSTPRHPSVRIGRGGVEIDEIVAHQRTKHSLGVDLDTFHSRRHSNSFYGMTIERRDTPSFITSNAFCNSSNGNRWVIRRCKSTLPCSTMRISGG